jgi:DNA-binding winged helix-turn-helix (wHTH) protein/TolB-like protein/Flp pilus assembly protein TadD
MQKGKSIRFGRFAVRPETGEIFRDGVPVRIQEQPLQLLLLLLETPGELVPRDAIRQRLWPADTFVDFDLGLNKAVAKLRETLGDNASSPAFIETVPKRGYRFTAAVEREEPELEDSSRLVVPARRLATAALIVVIALVAIGGYAWLGSSRSASADSQVVVAVLPFRDLSAAEHQSRQTSIIATEIIARLQKLRVPRLRVVSPGEVLSGSSGRSPLEQGRRLGADYVVDGTLRTHPTGARVTSVLLRVADGVELSGATFDGTATGEIDLQATFPRAIAQKVELEIVPPLTIHTAPHEAAVPEAAAAFRRAEYLRQRQNDSAEAAAAYETALRLDPRLARAHVGLADTTLWLGTSKAYSRARTRIGEALALDPDLAEAWAVLGLIEMFDRWNWAAAENAFARALELDRNDPAVLIRYAHFLAATRRLDEAIRIAQQAQRLAPASAPIRHYLGRLYAFHHQPENARYEWQNALEIDPDHYWSRLFLAFSEQDRGRWDEWYEQWKEAVRIRGELEQLPHAEQVVKTKGPMTFAQLLDHRSVMAATQKRGPAYTAAMVSAKRHDRAQTLFWIEQALAQRTPAVVYLGVEPAFDFLRTDPEFQRLLARLALPSR